MEPWPLVELNASAYPRSPTNENFRASESHLTHSSQARQSAPTGSPNSATGSATYSSWLNRIEAQFTALRYFTIDGTDHASHEEQTSMIRRYIRWRNHNAEDRTLREIVKRANAA